MATLKIYNGSWITVGGDHNPVTLDGGAGNVFLLVGQEIDTHQQSKGTFYAGPASDDIGVPDFREIEMQDLPVYAPDQYSNDQVALWAPYCGISQDMWASTRGRKAVVSGAFHREMGRHADHALVIEKAGTNICEDPIFGNSVISTYWYATGAGTVARTTDEARIGTHSAKCTFGTGGTGLLAYNLSGLTPYGVYTFSCWIKVPEDYDGEEIRIQPSGLSGASSEYISEWFQGDPVNEWFLLETRTTLGSDVAGAVGIRAASFPTVGKFIYADCVQWEESDHRTSFIWGDAGPGYSWATTPHASASTRAVTEVNMDEHVSLISGVDELSLVLWWQAPLDSDHDSWLSESYMFEAGNASDRFAVYYDGSEIVAEWDDSSVTAQAAYAHEFSSGDWVHIVVTIGSNIALYVNGELRETDDISATISPTEMNLGSNNSALLHAGGSYYEFALIDRQLTSVEVAQMYEAEAPIIDPRGIDIPRRQEDMILILERSSDPPQPPEGCAIIWMSDGSEKGDDGDVMIASSAGGTTMYGTLFDHSAGSSW